MPVMFLIDLFVKHHVFVATAILVNTTALGKLSVFLNCHTVFPTL